MDDQTAVNNTIIHKPIAFQDLFSFPDLDLTLFAMLPTDLYRPILIYLKAHKQNANRPTVKDAYEFKYLFSGHGSSEGQLKDPNGAAVDPETGNLFVADTGNGRIHVFRPDGEFVRTFGESKRADDYPIAICFDFDGNLVVLDSEASEIQIWDPNGILKSRFAHQNLLTPCGIAVDQNGHLLVTDMGTNKIHVFSPNGDWVREFGGKGAAIGEFDGPRGIAVDLRTGHVIVCDRYNHRICIFDRFDNPVSSFGVKGAEDFELKYPYGVCVDRDGHVLVTDTQNYKVKVFTSEGKLLRTAGCKGKAEGQLHLPRAAVFDKDGNIFCIDTFNHRIQLFG